MFNKQKIFYKIITLTILIIILSVLTLVFLIDEISGTVIKRSVSELFQNISIRAAREVHMFIYNTVDILESTSYIVSKLYSNEWQSKLYLNRLLLDTEGLEWICLIDKHGNKIIETQNYSDRKRYNYSEKKYFKEAMTGRNYFSDVFISESLIPTITIAVPVQKNKEIIGVLLSDVSVIYLWDLVEGIKIGETGHVYILDKRGFTIAHKQRERVLKRENFKHITAIKNLDKDIESPAEYKNGNGVFVLGAAVVVDDLGWYVVVEQSSEEAFSLITKIRYTIIILGIVTIILAITIGFLRINKITLPIKRLMEAVRKIGQGDLSCSINVESNDEIGELAESFNRMTSNLQDAQEKLIEHKQLAVLGKMSSRIAHEVRNPLEAIKGSAGVIKKDSDNELYQELADIIIQEVDQLNNFVTAVLCSVKKTNLNLVSVNINNILENICQLIVKDDRFEGITITKIFAPNMPECYLDPRHLQMALLNLVINAMEAIETEGQIKLTTKYTIDTRKCIEITVEDNGNGIPNEIKEEISNPFFTTKDNGTGLGLSYFYEIIKLHKGEVKVTSDINVGTTFMIKIPLTNKVEDNEEMLNV